MPLQLFSMKTHLCRIWLLPVAWHFVTVTLKGIAPIIGNRFRDYNTLANSSSVPPDALVHFPVLTIWTSLSAWSFYQIGIGIQALPETAMPIPALLKIGGIFQRPPHCRFLGLCFQHGTMYQLPCNCGTRGETGGKINEPAGLE